MRFDISYQPEEIRIGLTRLIEKHTIRTVLEIGSFLGSSAAFIAAHPSIEWVICVDPFEDHTDWSKMLAERGVPNPYFEPFREALQELGLWYKIISIHGQSQKVAWAMPKVDLVYVDGDHSYESCKADIELYLPKARKVICGDDHHRMPDGNYEFPGVARACEEYFGLTGYRVDRRFWWYERIT